METDLTAIRTIARWILQDGEVGLTAAQEGDYDTCASCLQAITIYARGLLTATTPAGGTPA